MNRLIPKSNNPKADLVYTPVSVCEMVVKHFNPKGVILEACKGSGNFLKVLPKNTLWCEIEEGKDFFDFKNKVDWIITNPPYSKMRAFIKHSMIISQNVVFLTSINHLWLKARLRDIKQEGFGIKEIMLIDTPKTFSPTGFQIGCFHLKKGYAGNIIFSDKRK